MMLIYPVLDRRMKTESMKRFTDTPIWDSRCMKLFWDMYLEKQDADQENDDIMIAAVMTQDHKREQCKERYTCAKTVHAVGEIDRIGFCHIQQYHERQENKPRNLNADMHKRYRHLERNDIPVNRKQEKRIDKFHDQSGLGRKALVGMRADHQGIIDETDGTEQDIGEQHKLDSLVCQSLQIDDDEDDDRYDDKKKPAHDRCLLFVFELIQSIFRCNLIDVFMLEIRDERRHRCQHHHKRQNKTDDRNDQIIHTCLLYTIPLLIHQYQKCFLHLLQLPSPRS